MGVLCWMGPIKTSIKNILFAHMGWWRWQLGEGLATCWAKTQATCPRVPDPRLRTAQGQGSFLKYLGRAITVQFLEEKGEGRGRKGRGGDGRERKACLKKLIFLYSCCWQKKEVGAVCSATLARDRVLIGCRRK